MDSREIALHISNISSVPSALINSATNEHEIISTGSAAEAILNFIDRSHLITAISEKRDCVFFRYVDRAGLSILVFNDGTDSSSLVIGPFFLTGQGQEKLMQALSRQYGGTLESHKIRGICSSVETKSLSFVDSVRSLIAELKGIGNAPVVEFSAPPDTENERYEIEDIEKNRLIEESITSSYDFERKIREAVGRGDRESLRRMLVPRNEQEMLRIREKRGFNIIDRFASRDLRQAKNTMLTLNTVFRISIESVGIPPIYIHTLSDGFAKRIEGEKEAGSLVALIDEMISAYCDVVLRMNIQSHSWRIIKVQKYIISHLTENISLETLSSVAGTTSQHLSRLFRKESGETLTDYIRRQKISEAKWILSSSDTPVTAIAESLGFSSVNYFCNVFMKEEGITPTQYRAGCELGKNC